LSQFAAVAATGVQLGEDAPPSPLSDLDVIFPSSISLISRVAQISSNVELALSH
jgi:hypothetical protein